MSQTERTLALPPTSVTGGDRNPVTGNRRGFLVLPARDAGSLWVTADGHAGAYVTVASTMGYIPVVWLEEAGSVQVQLVGNADERPRLFVRSLEDAHSVSVSEFSTHSEAKLVTGLPPGEYAIWAGPEEARFSEPEDAPRVVVAAGRRASTAVTAGDGPTRARLAGRIELTGDWPSALLAAYAANGSAESGPGMWRTLRVAPISRGLYSFSGAVLSSGDLYVLVDPFNFVVRVEETAREQAIHLRVPAPLRIRTAVTEETLGTPVETATYYWSPSAGGYTGYQGADVVAGKERDDTVLYLPDAPGSLIVDAPGYVSTSVDVQGSPLEILRVALSRSARVSVGLRMSGLAISGTGFQVELRGNGNQLIEPVNDGWAVFDTNVAPGRYTLRLVGAIGFTAAEVPVAVSPASEIRTVLEVIPGERRRANPRDG
jgi:hypothetical protein